jgi:lipopolysaccharide transport system ATP-binding protein
MKQVSNDIAISVQSICKTYHLDANGEDFLKYQLSSLFMAKTTSKGRKIEALQDITFDVKKGECIALVGKNGSGKSTMLKVLSKITAPTSGEARIVGRLASLLEVGSGFHQELSGRDNIYFNGALLGMSKAEIAAKYDEIVDFSEVGDFIDIPVKKYSSGMYVRLAYAVGAFLDNDILILDEVLSVGDQEFQEKCLANIQKLKNEGRTMIVVSHNQEFLNKFCDRMIYLEKGQIKYQGEMKNYWEL